MKTDSNLLATGALLLSIGSALAQAPLNDDLARAVPVTGFSIRTNGSNQNASWETGEPEHGLGAGGHSVWWSWDAPESGPAIVDLQGSFSGALVEVYRGKYVANLSRVTSEAFLNEDGTRKMAFDAAAGESYKIAADGAGGAQGQIQLHILLLTSNLPPLILEQPASQTVIEGETVTLAVRAASKAPANYDWRFNGGGSLGTSSSQLVLPIVSLGAAGNYQVIVGNSAGAVTSQVAVLTVRPKPPQILTQPLDQELVEGQTAMFTLTVSSSVLPLSYQWQYGSTSPFGFSGTDLVGMTNAMLVLNPARPDQAGAYRAIVSNAGGNATSQVARLTVHLPPPNNDFAARIPLAGANLSTQGFNRYGNKETGEDRHDGKDGQASVWWSWTAPATGLAEVDLTGSFRGAVVGVYIGGRVDSLDSAKPEVFTNADGTERGDFEVRAGEVYQIAVDGSTPTDTGDVKLRIAFLGPIEKPVISSQPKNAVVVVGQTATFKVEAVSVKPMFYQWLFNGVKVPGETNSVLILRNVVSNQAGSYQVEVRNVVGITTSSTAELTVLPLSPQILTQPSDLEVIEGDVANFTVEVQSAVPVQYQWRLYTTDLEDGTNASLRLTGVRTNQAGLYQVMVSNPGGQTNSRMASLVVHVRAINDFFTNRIVLNGTNFIVTGYSNQFAGVEFEEPPVPLLKGTNSVWWSWGGAGNGVGLLNWRGSYKGAGMGVFKGGVLLSTLSPVEMHYAGTNRVWFETETNVVYHLVVNSTDPGEYGQIQFQLTFYPNGVGPVIVQEPQSTEVLESQMTSLTVVATSQSPLEYQWKFRPVDATGWIDLAGATNATLNLSNVTANAEGEYQVQVQNQEGSVFSQIASVTVHQRPLNDNFAARQFVSGAQVTKHGSTQFATRELGEPDHGHTNGNASVWWSWLAPGNGFAEVDLSKSFSGAVAGIYASNRLDRLSPIPVDTRSNPDGTSRVRFIVTADQVYQIAVDGSTNGNAGEAWLQLTYEPGTITIVTQPADFTAVDGQNAVFAVVATSKAPIRYQWRLNGVSLAGETNQVMTLYNLRAGQTGVYEVVLSNGAVSVISRPALLTVLPPLPIITQSPTGQDVAVGANVTFKVEVVSLVSARYQWQFNGQNLAEATHAALALTNVQLSQSGSYQVLVSNAGGSVSSQPAMLAVNLPPANDNFVDRTFISGTERVLHGNNSYASYENGEPRHAGREASTSVWWSWATPIAGLAQVDLAGSFSNAVVGVYTGGRVEALLPVAPEGDTYPIVADRLRFKVVPQIPYQVAVDGSSAKNHGAIRLHLQVMPAPLITQQPISQAVALGEDATFAVKAESDLPLTYQWQLNGQDLAGAISNSLTMVAVTPNDLGFYRVRVTNQAGVITSQVAVLSLATVLKGQVTDALTSQPMPGVQVVVNGITNFTDLNGQYRLVNVSPGTLRADFDADQTVGEAPLTVQFIDLSRLRAVTLNATTNGYVPYTDTRTSVVTNQLTTFNFSMTPAPPPGGLRLVLNWELNPRDLDAHLMTPWIQGQSYEVFYPTNRRGGMLAAPFALLDVDKMDSYGPETITIGQFFEGTYHYFVHKYAGSTELRDSKAIVNIYDQTAQLRSISAPPEGVGQFWHVCDIDGKTKNIVLINRISDTKPGEIALNSLSAAPSNRPQSAGTEDSPSPLPGNGSGLSHRWTFGDGTTSTEAAPTKTYLEPGVYTVGLQITTLDNKIASEIKTNFITVLTGLIPPKITRQPLDQIVYSGADVQFTVSATGSPPLRYQWRFNDKDLLSATNESLFLSRVTASQEGYYRVLVTNAVGSALSDSASLTLRRPSVLQGTITDAADGKVLSGVSVVASGLVGLTDTEGHYVISNLAPGVLRANFGASVRSGYPPLRVQFFNLSIESALAVEGYKTGYYAYTSELVSLPPGETVRFDFSMSPAIPSSALRLVLNWGAYPKDLDAHLVTPMIEGERHHIWYSLGHRGSTNGVPNANLDIDQRNSFGPETITITRFYAGMYHYFVHNFYEFQKTGELTNSTATVQIYNNSGLFQTATVPVTGVGNYWDVCTIDGATQQITLINKILDAEPTIVVIGGNEVVSAAQQSSDPGSQVGQWGYLWEFGDGTVSTNFNPEKTYAYPGAYTVKLTATNALGQSDTRTKVKFISVTTPLLELSRVGADAVIQWQSADSGWQLESTINLDGRAWTKVAEVPWVVGATNSVTLHINGNRFFRLKGP